ncbi:hypothetical protein LWI29_011272 [Acer saccharum]|uniref:Uncharacterized protein n=1 Tax=Acer saccharum TaxID=4024 RepID=A0AA39VI86_ACESA|nr:hypothetical protein LWI29_011272 [Acer saccharum]
MDSKDVDLQITKQCTFKFTIIDRYIDEVTCEVVPLDVCQVILGSPYLWDRDAIHYRRLQKYRLVKEGKEFHINACKPKATNRLMTSTQAKRMGRFEHFGKRVESYRPRFSEEQIKKNASSIQKTGKRIVLPNSQPIIQDAPVSRKEKGPKEMGHIGANDACMEASVLVHDHGKTKIGGLVKVGEVIVTQVAGNVLEVIPSGQVPVLVAFGGSSSGQIFHGPDKYIGPGSFKDSCVENVLIFGDKGAEPFKGVSSGLLSSKSLKAKEIMKDALFIGRLFCTNFW